MMDATTFLSSCTTDDSVLSKSLTEYITSRNETIQKQADALAATLVDADKPIDDILADSGLVPGNIFSNGYTTDTMHNLLTKVRNAVEEDLDEIVDASSEVTSLDDLMTNTSSLIQSSIVYESAMNQLNSPDLSPTEISTRFVNDLHLKLADFSDNARSTADALNSIISDGSMPIRHKLDSIMDFAGMNAFSEVESDDPVDVGFPSPSKDYTGTSPIAAWGSDIADAVKYFDISNISNALKSAARVFSSGVRKVWSGIKSFSKKVVTKITEVTVAADDIRETKSFDDPTFNDFGYSFVWGGELPSLWAKCSYDKYLCFSFPGAKMYLWKEVDDWSHDVFCGHIRWYPVSESSYYNWCQSIMEARQHLNQPDITHDNVADEILKSFSDFSSDDAWTANADDKSLFEGLIRAKNIFSHYTACLNYLQSNYDNPSFFCLLFFGMEEKYPGTYSQAIPRYDWLYVKAPGPINSPTNIDFITELCGTHEYTLDLNSPNPLVAAHHIVFNELLEGINYALEKGGSMFFPYCHVSSFDVGRWTIITDTENAAAFSKALKLTLATIATVVVAIKTLGVVKKLRYKTLESGKIAQNAQNVLAKKLALGTATSEDTKLAYKMTKKFNLVNKLTGGFTDSTVGMTKWATSSGAASVMQPFRTQMNDDDNYSAIIDIIR